MWWLKWRLNAILCEQRRIWWVCTFAQAYLSLCHCTKSLLLPKMAICVLFTPAANTLVSLHICAGSHWKMWEVSRSLVLAAKALGSMHVCTDSPEPSIQYRNIMCWLKWRFLQRLCEQQMMWWVCTSNHRNSVQPSVRCSNASKNAPSAL